jgi:hypothetical protein
MLRQADADSPWLPLEQDEPITLNADGQATVQLRSFSRFTCKLFRGPKAAAHAARTAGNALANGASKLAESAIHRVADANPATVSVTLRRSYRVRQRPQIRLWPQQPLWRILPRGGCWRLAQLPASVSCVHRPHSHAMLSAACYTVHCCR